MVITYSKSKDQPGMVANPARGQLNRKNELFPVPLRAREFIWSSEMSSAVPSRISLLASSRVVLNMFFLFLFATNQNLRQT